MKKRMFDRTTKHPLFHYLIKLLEFPPYFPRAFMAFSNHFDILGHCL